MPNPPCGDANPEGKCGHDTARRCVGELIYEEAASEGPAGLARLERTINPPRIAALDGTASILNHLFGKDHARPFASSRSPRTSTPASPRWPRRCRKCSTRGPGGLDRPGPARDYILAQVKAQVRHGADYLDVNVDAFGESDLEFRKAMMRDYVRLHPPPRRRRPGERGQRLARGPAGRARGLVRGRARRHRRSPPQLAQDLHHGRVPPAPGARCRSSSSACSWTRSPPGPKGPTTAWTSSTPWPGRSSRPRSAATGSSPEDIFFDSTVFPLSIDMPMSADTPGYTYRTFETIRRIKRDPAMKGVHLSLGITNAVRDLPGRRTGVCRAYLAKAMEYGLDAGDRQRPPRLRLAAARPRAHGIRRRLRQAGRLGRGVPEGHRGDDGLLQGEPEDPRSNLTAARRPRFFPPAIYYNGAAMKSVVLFSGGIDSTTALAWARARSSEVHALTFDYGQRHRIEVAMAEADGAPHGRPADRPRDRPGPLRRIGPDRSRGGAPAMPEAVRHRARPALDLRPLPERGPPLARRLVRRSPRLRHGRHGLQRHRFAGLSRHAAGVRPGDERGRQGGNAGRVRRPRASGSSRRSSGCGNPRSSASGSGSGPTIPARSRATSGRKRRAGHAPRASCAAAPSPRRGSPIRSSSALKKKKERRP